MGIVYVLTNKQNGKRYVGQTIETLEHRWKEHCGCARRRDNDMLIARAIRKYGPDEFDRAILEECDNSRLGAMEIKWIAELKTFRHDPDSWGYNLTRGGNGGLLGHRHSPESRQKQREKALGRKHDAEAKQRMRLAKLGKKQSAESVEKRAQANRGKKRTPEQRKRMSEAHKGHVVTVETREKLSIAGTGRITSEETKQLLRVASMGRRDSDETRRRKSVAKSKPVQMFSVDGVLISEYPSIKIAGKTSGTSSISISRSLKDGRAHAGFVWKYKGKG